MQNPTEAATAAASNASTSATTVTPTLQKPAQSKAVNAASVTSTDSNKSVSRASSSATAVTAPALPATTSASKSASFKPTPSDGMVITPDLDGANAYLAACWSAQDAALSPDASSRAGAGGFAQSGQRMRSADAFRAARDAEEFLAGYPTPLPKHFQTKATPNLDFFTNKLKMNGKHYRNDFITGPLAKDNAYLETAHDYIQWLFPIPEPGMNPNASPLQPHELAVITANPHEYQVLVLEHYRVYLRFIGFRLVSLATGELARNTNDCFDRLRNLNNKGHNYLRITRVLKCLSLFGLGHLQAPLVWALVKEALVAGTVPNSVSSARFYWCAVVKDDTERKKLQELAEAIYLFNNSSVNSDVSSFVSGKSGKLKAGVVAAIVAAQWREVQAKNNNGGWMIVKHDDDGTNSNANTDESSDRHCVVVANNESK